MVLVADAEEYQRGQVIRVGDHVADVDASPLQLVAHELAVLLVADARQHGGPQSEAGAADRRVSRGAAEIAREGADFLQRRADLLSVQIDSGAADADKIEAPVHRRAPLGRAPLRRGGASFKRCPSAMTSACASTIGSTNERNGERRSSPSRNASDAFGTRGEARLSVMPMTSVPRPRALRAMSITSGV